MHEIANMDIPKHLNYEAIRRNKIGEIAGRLATEIRGYADNRGLSADEQVEMLRKELDYGLPETDI